MLAAMMTSLSSRAASWRAAVVVALLLIGAGCVSERAQVEETEQMLAAAGFRMEPADTPERQAQLVTLPPHRLLMPQLRAGNQDTVGYVYADPDVCHCVFVGDARAYQAFQQLAFQKRLADEYWQAAQMQADAAFDLGMWAPGFWGPAPVIVVHEHDRPRR